MQVYKEVCVDLPEQIFTEIVAILLDISELPPKRFFAMFKADMDFEDDLGFLGYYKTSALSGENVHDAFGVLIKELHDKQMSILDALRKEL